MRRADFLLGAGDFQFAEVFKPKVNILRDDWGALQRGGGKPHDHEPHLALQQNLQEAQLTF
jgi:hypothetical protein